MALAFWVTGAHFKILQLDHNLRIGELEVALQGDSLNTPTPRIYGALRKRKAEHRQEHRWRRVMIWPHVMFPHVMFTLVGLVSGVALLVIDSMK